MAKLPSYYKLPEYKAAHRTAARWPASVQWPVLPSSATAALPLPAEGQVNGWPDTRPAGSPRRLGGLMPDSTTGSPRWSSGSATRPRSSPPASLQNEHAKLSELVADLQCG